MNHTYNGLVEELDMVHASDTYCVHKTLSAYFHIPCGRKRLLLHPPVKRIATWVYIKGERKRFPERDLWAGRHSLENKAKWENDTGCECTTFECTNTGPNSEGPECTTPECTYANECTSTKDKLKRVNAPHLNAPLPAQSGKGLNAPYMNAPI